MVHHKRHLIVFALGWLAAGAAGATQVNVVGLFPGKALVEIDGARPRMLAAGETAPGGVRLIAADSDAAIVEIDGKRQTLRLGQSASARTDSSARPTVTLVADARGHFVTLGSINGSTMRFLVDTGASTVALSSAEAKRMGVNHLKGERGFTSTANGVVPVYRVVLDQVRIGEIVLNQVEAVVIEGDGLPIGLLGMSFLKRLEMRREGSTLTLVKRY